MACLFVSVACASTERLYEGPQRLASEIAIVTVEQDSAVGTYFLGGVNASIERVDGRMIEADSVELVPGSHELCARFTNTTGFGSHLEFGGPLGRLQFQARAGREYRVESRYDKENGGYLVLVDTFDNEEIADSIVPVHLRNPVRLDLSDEGWELASAGLASCTQRIATWLRSGATLENRTEIVEVVETIYDVGTRPDLEAALKDRERVIDNATSIGDEWTVLARGPGSASFEYRGDFIRRSGRGHGVGHLKIDGGRLLYFIYEVTDKEMPSADRDAWLARFERQ